MTETLDIRRVNVEFLRPGPAHNQLLSPFTQYSRRLQRRRRRRRHRAVRAPRLRAAPQGAALRDRRSERPARDAPRDRPRHGPASSRPCPGFTGALTNDAVAAATLVHLRAHAVGRGAGAAAVRAGRSAGRIDGAAVSIQTRPPVSLTRHIRTVSSEGLVWPDVPRILFVCGDPDDVPFDGARDDPDRCDRPLPVPESRRRGGRERREREQFGDLLTILVNPTLADAAARVRGATLHAHPRAHARRSRRGVAGVVRLWCSAMRSGARGRGVGRAVRQRDHASRAIARPSSPSPAATAATSARRRARRQLRARRPSGRNPVRRRRRNFR